MMSSYTLASSTLRSLLQDPLLKVEKISKTMDDLSELLADQNEIDEAMDLNNNGAINDDEINRELEDLEKDQRKQKDDREAAADRENQSEDQVRRRLEDLSLKKQDENILENQKVSERLLSA
jgi:charged multivesicular body protein 7